MVEEVIRIEVPDVVDFDQMSHLQLGLYDANGSFIRMIIEQSKPTEKIEVTHCGAPDAVNVRLW
jgi:hypothetical protein